MGTEGVSDAGQCAWHSTGPHPTLPRPGASPPTARSWDRCWALQTRSIQARQGMRINTNSING